MTVERITSIRIENGCDSCVMAKRYKHGGSIFLAMTLDEKVRYGMIALTGASVVLAGLGIHVNPLAVAGGMGGD